MKYFLAVCVSFFLLSCPVFAQGKNYIKHAVSKGETIRQIAQKYKISPYDIYKLNPDAQSGVKENDVLLIPTVNSQSTKNTQLTKTHIVKAKETLFSISRDYQVYIDDLKKLNSDLLQDGLKVGQTIRIPASSTKAVEVKASSAVVLPAKSKNNSYHIVAPQETKYGIAKQYGISIEELERLNPEVGSNLEIGTKLKISPNTTEKEVVKSEIPREKTNVSLKSQEKIDVKDSVKPLVEKGFSSYEVKAKETLFSLSQSLHISQEQLIAMNPSLKDGVKTGMILRVPANEESALILKSSPRFTDLSTNISNETVKRLVLLLPFNASKIQGDTLTAIGARLKKDAFLNMTLDFYSGALMAIDSAKTLGLNVDVQIYDSEESKLSSNVAQVVKENQLEKADVIIGPFYQQYVEKLAFLLKDTKVAIISPLSKDLVKSYPNLYQAMPTNETARTAIFDFMISKNANIIVVNDLKKVADKAFISQRYPKAKFVLLNETGGLNPENLRALLVKGRINYVVLDTEKTGLILATTNLLLNELANFQIQLAIIEPNPTLDFEEVSMKRLTVLKMIYPAISRDNDSPESVLFENEYKKINKIFPSQFASKGFDITFDTLLRLSQAKGFEASANEDKTQQVETKFEYVKKSNGGYSNKGVYILEFQEDFSVKQIN